MRVYSPRFKSECFQAPNEYGGRRNIVQELTSFRLRKSGRGEVAFSYALSLRLSINSSDPHICDREWAEKH